MTTQQLLQLRALIILVNPYIQRIPEMLDIENAAVDALFSGDFYSVLSAVRTGLHLPGFHTILKTRLRVWLSVALRGLGEEAAQAA